MANSSSTDSSISMSSRRAVIQISRRRILPHINLQNRRNIFAYLIRELRRTRGEREARIAREWTSTKKIALRSIFSRSLLFAYNTQKITTILQATTIYFTGLDLYDYFSCLGLLGYKMDISFLFTGIQIIDKKGQRHVL